MKSISKFAGLSLAVLCFSSSAIAHADVVTVNATDVIYAAGTQSLLAHSVGGTVPGSVSVSGVSSISFSVTGDIIMNLGTGNSLNDADGVGAGSATSFNTGFGSLSGITLPGAGDLVFPFLPSQSPFDPPQPTASICDFRHTANNRTARLD